jgi:hypothetical protein
LGLIGERRQWSFTSDAGEDITGDGYGFQDEEGVPLHFTDIGRAMPGSFIFKVSGVTHRIGVLQDAAFEPGRRLTLVPEPANAYDRNALAVFDETMKLHIGYVPRDLAEGLAIALRQGEKRHALCVWQWRKKDRTRVGIEVLVAPSFDDLRIS